jgi:hypothetical protein
MMSQASVQLTLVNPRGEIAPPPTYTPTPRLAGLAGMTIGLYSNSKPGMDNFYTALAQVIQRQYPSARTVVLRGGFEIRDEDVKSWLPQIDTFIYAVGD